MVGYLRISSLLSMMIKEFGRSGFGKVMAKNKVAPFFRTRCRSASLSVRLSRCDDCIVIGPHQVYLCEDFTEQCTACKWSVCCGVAASLMHS